MSLLDPALTELRAGIDDVLEHVSFIETALSLRPRLGSFLDWQNITPGQKQLAQTYMNTNAEGGLILQGLFVRMAGAYESFIRRLVRDSIRAINDAKLKFEELDAELRNRNRHCVGRALTTVFEPASFEQINFDILCSEVGTCTPNASQVTLSADAFATVLRGISAKRTELAFEAMGAVLNWDKVGSDNRIKGILQLTKNREAAKAVQERLAAVQMQRNSFAHTAIGGVVITPEELKTTANILGTLGSILKSEMENHIQSLI